MNKEQEKGFAKGVAYCIGLQEREWGNGDLIFNEAGMTLKDYKDAKVDEYDLRVIIEISNNKGGLNAEKQICKHCGKTKKEHFYRYEKQYNEGLRDNFYCKKYGIVQFSSEDTNYTTNETEAEA